MEWQEVNRRQKKSKEILDWIEPKFFRFITGNVNRIEEISGAKVKFNREEGTCIIIGNGNQRESAKQLIKEKLDTHHNYIDESYMELEFVKPHHISIVMGRKGATIERLRNKLNVILKANGYHGADKLFIKGDPNNIQNAIIYLEQFVWIIDRNSHQQWNKFMLGNPESITTIHNPGNPDSLSFLSNLTVNVDDTSQEKYLLGAFQNTKKEQQSLEREMSSPCVKYSLQLGRTFSQLKPLTYPSEDQSFKDSLIYQKFTHANLNMDKLKSQLERIESKGWYELFIYTPKPFHKIRYRIFLSNDQLCFIANEEAGVNGNELRNIRKGPGYFVNSDMLKNRFDLIDPENGMTTRVNTFIYNDIQSDKEVLDSGNQLDEDDFNHHLEILAPMFNGITIRQNEISIPDLPQGYNLIYLRVTSTSYCFGENGENILRTSEENVFIQEDNFFPPNQTDVVVLFFENEVINNLLKENDWQPSQVVDEMANLIKSSKIMLANYLA